MSLVKHNGIAPHQHTCVQTIQAPQLRFLGVTNYTEVYAQMREFTEQRQAQSIDQIWLTQHHPVYTLGLAADFRHVLNAGQVPVVNVDRGGQVTYHGPGQLVVYPLLELRRYGLKVREYVHLLEQVLIDTLCDLGILGGCRLSGAPGVYVPNVALNSSVANAPPLNACEAANPAISNSTGVFVSPSLAKIAALGIKVRRGYTYHGLAFNVNMNLQPFLGINPCGYEGLQTTDLNAQGVKIELEEVALLLATKLLTALNCAQSAA